MAGNFAADISKFILHANVNLDKAVQMAVILASQGVIMNTPVLTGRLRGNWQFGYTFPTGVLTTKDTGGAGTLAKITGLAMKLKAGGECWIVNNLPYAGRIEYGYSKIKSPRGMVRITLANLPAAIENYVRSLP